MNRCPIVLRAVAALAIFLCILPHALAAPEPVDGGLRFEFRDAGAARVYLAGSFNGWGPNTNGQITTPAHPMTRDADGVWSVTVPIADDLIKYKFVVEDAQGRFSWHPDPTVAQRDADGNSVVVVGSTESSVVALESPSIDVRIAPASGRITLLLKDPASGAVRDTLVLPPCTIDGRPQAPIRDDRAAGGSLAGPDAAIRIRAVSPRAVAIEWSANGNAPRAFEASLEDNSRYYGGGERFHAINQKGYLLHMGSLDRPEDKGTCTYKPVPYIFSTRGYGLWLDSTSPSIFDLNATERDRIRITDTSTRMRLVVIAGPSMQDALTEFTSLTGRPPVPPAWAFAPWKSRNVHHNREEVLEDVERSRGLDLPMSVLVLDSPWETSYNDFILNERQFSEPDSLFARIRELGALPCFWLTPFINQSNTTDMVGIDAGPSGNFAEAVENGYLVRTPSGEPMIAEWWKGAGGLVDFTNPRAVAWWHEQMKPMLRWGIAAIKCDDGESNFVQDAVFHDGSTAADMKGRYADLYLKASRDFLEQHRSDGDHTLIARCGFTGTGQYPFGWAGDNEASWSFDNGLPGVIIAAQNAALSGLPMWGCDIAGYMGDATPELFVRWTQFAAFTPLMMVHMTSNKGPWDYGDQALGIYRDFARLHTRLWPYIDAAAREARDHGIPIIRPMALAFPGDGAAANERFQYMFGPDLLVAPMDHPGTSRSVYLPAGAWTDYWTGARFDGPRTMEVEVPLERIPVFVRDGAIIPMVRDDIDTLVERFDGMDPEVVALDDQRVIEIWPGVNPRSAVFGDLRIDIGDAGLVTVVGPYERIEDHESGRTAPDGVTRIHLRRR